MDMALLVNRKLGHEKLSWGARKESSFFSNRRLFRFIILMASVRHSRACETKKNEKKKEGRICKRKKERKKVENTGKKMLFFRTGQWRILRVWMQELRPFLQILNEPWGKKKISFLFFQYVLKTLSDRKLPTEGKRGVFFVKRGSRNLQHLGTFEKSSHFGYVINEGRGRMKDTSWMWPSRAYRAFVKKSTAS